jgi:hypothetical protein
MLLAAIAATVFCLQRRRVLQFYSTDPEKAGVDAVALVDTRSPDAHIMDAAMNIPGLVKGARLTRHVSSKTAGFLLIVT